MKCAADAVRKMRLYNAQHEAYGHMLIDFIQTATVFHAAGGYVFYRREGRAQELIDAVVASLENGVSAAEPISFRMREGGKSWWADEFERADEAITDEVLRMRAHFRECGFPNDSLAEMEPGPLPEKLTAEERNTRAARTEYFESRGRSAARLWTYTLFCFMAAEEFATGRPRFSTENLWQFVYLPFAAEMRVWWERFLSGKREGQRANERREKDMEGVILRDMRIEMTSAAEEAKERRRQEKAKSIPPEIAQAFRDAMKPDGFGGAVKFR